MTNSPFPTAGRIAGIDFGTVRVGVAISDPARIIASPWETYTRRGLPADEQYFRELVREECLVGFVVGAPVHMSGDESLKSREARAFGAWLSAATGLPVCFQDERYSTAEANRIIAGARHRKRKGKQLRDQLAAQIILTGFLEAGEATPPKALDG